MIFRRSKKKVKEGMGTMDKVVTGIIVGWAAASIFGLSRTQKWRNILSRIKDTWIQTSKKWITIFWKVAVKVLDFFDKK